MRIARAHPRPLQWARIGVRGPGPTTLVLALSRSRERGWRIACVVVPLLVLAGCGGAASSSASASRPIIISSTNTPGPPPPTPSGPAAAVSTVLTPFATSIPTAGAASAAASAAATPTAAPNQVKIQDFSFTPSALNVTVGTQVTWVNGGPSNHTVTANDGSFDSAAIQRNASFSFTFSKAGTFAYHCSLHPTMTGTVTVS